ncbi:TetR/AcrR family transcriptional regulator [Promicromonospora sp. NPDC060271]|uniref:TetR/AcrR family transcriptional regulator n=1 Tax=Promicromonospora sp. NPDC060271 TaxID=3347089 RepID=UPI00365D02A6
MSHPTAPRRRRADAQRNRQALLDAARTALADGDAPFSLEAVARAAGVGIGTLYRNFPTKEALAAAVYEAQLTDLVAQAGNLLERMPADEALREWLGQFARLATTKRGMLDALRQGMLESAQQSDVAGRRGRLAAAITPILDAGARAGSIRSDVVADDVVLLAAGALMPVEVDDARIQRLLGLVTDALRP